MLTPFPSSSNPDSAGYEGTRLINYFFRQIEGQEHGILVARSGMKEFADTGHQIEAMREFKGDIFAVANGSLWRIREDSATIVGSVASGGARMAATWRHLAIVADGRYFVYDGASVKEVETGSVTDPFDVESLDGFIIVAGSLSGRNDAITISSLDDGATFSNLQFAFAESDADDLVAIERLGEQLVLIGEKTIQLFYNSGDIDMPIQPIDGSTIRIGAMKNTIAIADQSIFMIRPDGVVLRTGQGVTAISRQEISGIISDVNSAFVFSEKGHEFYAINRASGTTLVYDITNGRWHERTQGLTYGSWGVTSALSQNGTTFLGCSDGKVATFEADRFDDYGTPLLNEVISSPAKNDRKGFRVSGIYLQLAGGQTLPDRDPKIMLQTSNDGRKWGREKWRTLANAGRHYREVRWNALGRFTALWWRLRITDPVERDLFRMEIEAK